MGLKPRKTATYGRLRVSLASVAKTLPKGLGMPRLLKSFAVWVGNKPRGSLGYFDGIVGDSFTHGGLSDDANRAIDEATGPFIALGEGSRVALWSHSKGAPAVVLIDSEGQYRALADSLERFLLAWSAQKSDVDDLDHLDRDDDDPPSAHADLATWLKEQGVNAGRKRKVPDFAEWMASFPELEAAKAPQEGYPKPPKDMCKRIAACVGLLTAEQPLAGLLEELGVDVGTLRTEDDFRFFGVPEHGYALTFEWVSDKFGAWRSPHGPYNKGAKGKLAKEYRMLVSAEFCPEGYESSDRLHGDVTFNEFVGELPFGVTFADDIANLKRNKRLELKYETFFCSEENFVSTWFDTVDPDDDDSSIPPGRIEQVRIALERPS